jgi:hypothetical protein
MLWQGPNKRPVRQALRAGSPARRDTSDRPRDGSLKSRTPPNPGETLDNIHVAVAKPTDQHRPLPRRPRYSSIFTSCRPSPAGEFIAGAAGAETWSRVL